jgi:hypothetical protein
MLHARLLRVEAAGRAYAHALRLDPSQGRCMYAYVCVCTHVHVRVHEHVLVYAPGFPGCFGQTCLEIGGVNVLLDSSVD